MRQRFWYDPHDRGAVAGTLHERTMKILGIWLQTLAV